MTRARGFDDDPGQIAEWEAAAAEDRRADGLVPCAGPYCQEWLHPEEVVTSDLSDSYGPCCAVIGAEVDAVLVEAVCLTILSRGTVLGRRVSVGPYTPAVRGETTPDWCVTYKNGAVLYTAHDIFEVARWYCLVESGKMEVDPSMGTDMRPSDATLAAWDFEDRTMYMRRD